MPVKAVNPSRADLLEDVRRLRAENKNLRGQLGQENPRQANLASGQTNLTARILELESENDGLQDQLDKISDLAAAPEDGREEDPDELVDKLNDIIDVVSGDGDEGED
jgi:regulator of replication initiation timing